MIVDPATRPAAATSLPDGSVERAEFLGTPGERIFSFLHLPREEPRAAVLICSPLHGEFARNYRREVLFARRLVTQGIAVERFHYRRTGNSDGDGERLTFDSMVDDSVSCAQHLLHETGEVPFIVVGTRWGSIIAASAAARNLDAALVLWEPLLETARFFKDAFRNRLIKEKRAGTKGIETGADLERRLAAGEPVPVVAHRIEVELYLSSVARTLEGELGSSPRDVLLVQLGSNVTLKADLVRQVERWKSAGLRVETACIRGQEAWWFADETLVDEGSRAVTQELIGRTTEWIGRRARRLPVEGAG